MAIKPRTIDDWCGGFAKLYGKPDSRRTPEELWIATMAHCSGIGEEIRRVDYRKLMKSAAHTFCWACSYINRCKVDANDPLFKWDGTLCEMVLLKFPRICGHCREKHCICNPQTMDAKNNKAAGYLKLYEEWKKIEKYGYTMRDCLNMFDGIYGGRIHMSTLESIGFHFLEEAGEEAMAVRQLIQLRGVLKHKFPGVDRAFLNRLSSIPGLIEAYASDDIPRKKGKPVLDFVCKDPAHIKARIIDAKMGFVIELADTFSWFCAILLKLEQVLKKSGLWDSHPGGGVLPFDIEACLQREYGRRGRDLVCPTCKKTPCKCLFFDSA